jgi:pyridinium-3,5-bisthiocarboxylic acid mononucleotide nickel chelatase
MRVCYFDAFSGISGDMTVGGLADAGADQEAIVQALGGLGTDATYEFAKVKRRGIGAMKFRVTVGETKRPRHLPAILKMIEGCEAPQRAKERAIAAFERQGSAEASAKRAGWRHSVQACSDFNQSRINGSFNGQTPGSV